MKNLIQKAHSPQYSMAWLFLVACLLGIYIFLINL
jgi:hypothetical protein